MKTKNMILPKEGDTRKKSLKSLLKKLKDITKVAEEFLNPSPATIGKIEILLKEMYNFSTKETEIAKKNYEVVPELYLESLDAESVWQQIDIKNNIEMPTILENISSALAISDEVLNFKIKTTVDDDDDDDDNDNDEDLSNDEHNEDEEDELNMIEEEEEYKTKNTKKKKKNIKSSIVDDKFFKLSELDTFLKQEDKKEMLKNSKTADNESFIDYFSKELGVGGKASDDETNVNYKDFFDGSGNEEDEDDVNDDETFFENEDDLQKPNQYEEDEEDSENADEEADDDISENFEDHKKNKFDKNNENTAEEKETGNNSDNDDENSGDELKNDDENVKSSYEARQEKLKERIAGLEEEALAGRSWQLKGEVKALNRPQNSLLEEVLEFDAGTRPAPIITQETNLRLEDIIHQRIKDQAWDDPERKVKPVKEPQDFRKKLVLDAEKSKESLAQIYEKEYQKQLEKLNIGNDTTENEEEPKEHKEIKAMMKELFKKLDALSNFHFTPKPAQAEPKIITNTPVINIEEVAPVAVSDAQMLAPEEVKNKAKGDVMGKSERSKTDKNRERRHKKEFQKRKFKEKEERELQKLKDGVPLTKKEDKEKALRSIIKNRNVSKMAQSSDAPIKSSTSFFNQLQGNTTAVGVKVKRKSNKFSNSDLSAKKVKL